MIGVSSATLLKPGALTQEEIDKIREHPWLGERIVAPVPGARRARTPGDRVPPRAVERLRLPRGLRGVEIPLAPRIFAVVDAYDAMTKDQPYREAYTIEEARRELATMAGLDFDPVVVEVFLSMDVTTIDDWPPTATTY